MPGNGDLPVCEIRPMHLLDKIKEAFVHSRNTYGSVRIWRYWLRRGYEFSRHRVARLMKKAQIVPRKAEKWHPQTTKPRIGARIAPNLLDQDFTASRPNEKWVGDITYIDTQEDWLYLASIMDLFSRRIIGWQWRIESIQNLWKEPGRWPFSIDIRKIR